jgi:hypothetical protein
MTIENIDDPVDPKLLGGEEPDAEVTPKKDPPETPSGDGAEPEPDAAVEGEAEADAARDKQIPRARFDEVNTDRKSVV